MKIIGLCGGSGSGKGTVAKMFLSYGIPSIDTDLVYHELTSRKSYCLDELVAEFGEEILSGDGSLDRRKLSTIVFCGDASAENRMKLNYIAHKHVLKYVRDELNVYKKKGARAVLVDAPLLFESKFNKECDLIIAVIADKNVRIQRIINRDGISVESATLRIQTQLTDAFLIEKSDFIVNNSGDLLKTKVQVEKIAKKILYQ